MAHPRLVLSGRKVTLRSSDEQDLPALLGLWNDGAVMRWVKFPNGLGYDEAKMADWLTHVHAHPDRFHFCVYGRDGDFFGEAYCRIDRAVRRASLDIKFVPAAQGGGRSRDAFQTLIRWVFESLPEADVVWTQPSEKNLPARTLYYSCGLRSKERPPDMEAGESYWELSRESWLKGLGAAEVLRGPGIPTARGDVE